MREKKIEEILEEKKQQDIILFSNWSKLSEIATDLSDNEAMRGFYIDFSNCSECKENFEKFKKLRQKILLKKFRYDHKSFLELNDYDKALMLENEDFMDYAIYSIEDRDFMELYVPIVNYIKDEKIKEEVENQFLKIRLQLSLNRCLEQPNRLFGLRQEECLFLINSKTNLEKFAKILEPGFYSSLCFRFSRSFGIRKDNSANENLEFYKKKRDEYIDEVFTKKMTLLVPFNNSQIIQFMCERYFHQNSSIILGKIETLEEFSQYSDFEKKYDISLDIFREIYSVANDRTDSNIGALDLIEKIVKINNNLEKQGSSFGKQFDLVYDTARMYAGKMLCETLSLKPTDLTNEKPFAYFTHTLTKCESIARSEEEIIKSWQNTNSCNKLYKDKRTNLISLCYITHINPIHFQDVKYVLNNFNQEAVDENVTYLFNSLNPSSIIHMSPTNSTSKNPEFKHEWFLPPKMFAQATANSPQSIYDDNNGFFDHNELVYMRFPDENHKNNELTPCAILTSNKTPTPQELRHAKAFNIPIVYRDREKCVNFSNGTNKYKSIPIGKEIE